MLAFQTLQSAGEQVLPTVLRAAEISTLLCRLASNLHCTCCQHAVTVSAEAMHNSGIELFKMLLNSVTGWFAVIERRQDQSTFLCGMAIWEPGRVFLRFICAIDWPLNLTVLSAYVKYQPLCDTTSNKMQPCMRGTGDCFLL